MAEPTPEFLAALDRQIEAAPAGEVKWMLEATRARARRLPDVPGPDRRDWTSVG